MWLDVYTEVHHVGMLLDSNATYCYFHDVTGQRSISTIMNWANSAPKFYLPTEVLGASKGNTILHCSHNVNNIMACCDMAIQDQKLEHNKQSQQVANASSNQWISQGQVKILEQIFSHQRAFIVTLFLGKLIFIQAS